MEVRDVAVEAGWSKDVSRTVEHSGDGEGVAVMKGNGCYFSDCLRAGRRLWGSKEEKTNVLAIQAERGGTIPLA